MLCAAAELPVAIPDGKEPEQGIAGGLAGQGLLRDTEHGYIYAGVTRPQEAVKLDRIGDMQVVLLDADDGTLLETLDFDRALREVFPGAVYLHGARTWTVEALDLQAAQALTDKVADVTDTAAQRDLGGCRAALGGIRMTHRVVKYLVKRFGRTVGGAPLDLPERTFTTRALWLDVPPGTRAGVTDLLGALHALEHALVGIAPLALSCDPADLAGFSILMARHSGAPALFVYDGYEGGIGLADRAYADLPRLLAMARDVLASCGCESGCPACCLSARCGNDNQPMDKTGAALLAAELLAGAS
jgi:DEAD/DEAH box helicase domain-containing protein